MGTYLKVLSESFLMNTNMTGFMVITILAFLCFGIGRVKMKVSLLV